MLEKILKKINSTLPVFRGAPLASLTTFRIGGKADYLAEPETAEDAAALYTECRHAGIPVFILGCGANVLVSDQGIRGLTLSTRRLKTLARRNGELVFGAGWDIDAAAEKALAFGLRCLDFAAGMPSSVGGAVWMNARCYGSEISEIFSSALVATENGILEKTFQPEEWSYKISPFQSIDGIILQAAFRAFPDEPDKIEQDMEAHRKDREEKGHYRAPCAGSIFKNNRDFGQPSGVLIDQAGFKGLRIGGAQVSPWHGNIIINTGNATASEIRSLIEAVKDGLFSRTGFLLEEEVLYAGDWSRYQRLTIPTG